MEGDYIKINRWLRPLSCIYGFCIDDIYGGSLFTDMAYFVYSDGTVYFDEELL